MSTQTRIVRLKKYNHRIVTDCDVYIGPYVKNASWNLPESKWSNPYHLENNSLQLYREHILSKPHLCGDNLLELRDKTLGCFCNDMNFCHGQVLIDLLCEHLTQCNSEDETSPCSVLYFFGEKSPLSNLYPCHLEFKGKTFMSAYHLFLWKKAKAHSENCYAEGIEVAENTTQILHWSRLLACSIRTFSADDFLSVFWNSVEEMYEILLLKWEMVPAFRNMLESYSNHFFAEASVNTFWGCGLKYSDKCTLATMDSFLKAAVGSNVMGWLLFFLLQQKKSVIYDNDADEIVDAADKLDSFNQTHNLPIVSMLDDYPDTKVSQGYELVCKVVCK
jgi:predicted NAD-dependent protein-ADP-ribosyltransferase YbiA (DUF1768 family)